MTGLNQVKEAILSALEGAGLTALGRFGTQAERSYTCLLYTSSHRWGC